MLEIGPQLFPFVSGEHGGAWLSEFAVSLLQLIYVVAVTRKPNTGVPPLPGRDTTLPFPAIASTACRRIPGAPFSETRINHGWPAKPAVSNLLLRGRRGRRGRLPHPAPHPLGTPPPTPSVCRAVVGRLMKFRRPALPINAGVFTVRRRSRPSAVSGNPGIALVGSTESWARSWSTAGIARREGCVGFAICGAAWRLPM